MYHIGFGDCFLVTFPKNRHVLIDCGLHHEYKKKEEKTKKLVELIKQHSGGNLAVVIASHYHHDHISGFGYHGSLFHAMEAKEIWLPYYLNRSHPAFRIMENKWKRRRRTLGILDPQRAAKLDALRIANDTSLQTLLDPWDHCEPTIRYLSADSGFTESPAIPGVGIQILGPHVDNPWLSKGKYTSSGEGGAEESKPYEPGDSYLTQLEYVAEIGRASGESSESGLSDLVASYDIGYGNPTERDEEDGAVDDDEETHEAEVDSPTRPLNEIKIPSPFKAHWKIDDAEAFEHFSSLNNAIPFKPDDYFSAYTDRSGKEHNNLSLCVLFSYGGKKLLFTGDAQYGAWKAIYKDTNLLDQLDEIELLKVSHHGSHNGTPASLVRGMGRFVSLVSTNEGWPWKSIPKKRLLHALDRRGPVLRSDFPRVRSSTTNWYSVQPGKGSSNQPRQWTDVYLNAEP
jgi:beta-lactamase superfamily II metal-dependent hydrolase